MNRLVLILASLAALATGSMSHQPITLALTLIGEEPRIGGWPSVRVDIANPYDAPTRVVDVWKRGDLRCAYIQVLLTRRGVEVDHPVPICDPGPMGPGDLVELKPGQRRFLTLRTWDWDGGSNLPAGDYSLGISLLRDPLDRHSLVLSSPVQFTVHR
jgi:hypothetical protein